MVINIINIIVITGRVLEKIDHSELSYLKETFRIFSLNYQIINLDSRSRKEKDQSIAKQNEFGWHRLKVNGVGQKCNLLDYGC